MWLQFLNPSSQLHWQCLMIAFCNGQGRTPHVANLTLSSPAYKGVCTELQDITICDKVKHSRLRHQRYSLPEARLPIGPLAPEIASVAGINVQFKESSLHIHSTRTMTNNAARCDIEAGKQDDNQSQSKFESVWLYPRSVDGALRDPSEPVRKTSLVDCGENEPKDNAFLPHEAAEYAGH